MTLRDHLLQAHLSAAELARRLGVAHSTVLRWVSGEMKVSAERAIQIERVTGMPRHELRPDLWDEPGAAAAQEAA